MAARKKKSRKKRARSRRPTGPGPLAPRIAIAGLRVFVGALFLDAIQYKMFSQGLPLAQALDNFVNNEYVPLIQASLAHPPHVFGTQVPGFAWLLEHVMLQDGWRTFFAAAILLFEALLGLSLVLGAATRLFAVLGALLMIVFGMAKNLYFLTSSRGPQWLLAVVLIVLAVLAAGRFFGLDARLKERLPSWVS